MGTSQAIGELGVALAPQHLNPVLQSVSAAQAAPKPPLPGMQEVLAAVSVPLWAATHAFEYVRPSQPQTAAGLQSTPPTNRAMQ